MYMKLECVNQVTGGPVNTDNIKTTKFAIYIYIYIYIYHNILHWNILIINFLSHIVLYWSSKYCNMSKQCNYILSSLQNNYEQERKYYNSLETKVMYIYNLIYVSQGIHINTSYQLTKNPFPPTLSVPPKNCPFFCSLFALPE